MAPMWDLTRLFPDLLSSSGNAFGQQERLLFSTPAQHWQHREVHFFTKSEGPLSQLLWCSPPQRPGQSHIQWLEALPVALQTATPWWCCLLMADVETGWSNWTAAGSKQGGRWACFFEAETPYIIIIVGWKYCILHISISEDFHMYISVNYSLFICSVSTQNSLAILDFLWMILICPYPQYNNWNGLSVSASANGANTSEVSIHSLYSLCHVAENQAASPPQMGQGKTSDMSTEHTSSTLSLPPHLHNPAQTGVKKALHLITPRKVRALGLAFYWKNKQPDSLECQGLWSSGLHTGPAAINSPVLIPALTITSPVTLSKLLNLSALAFSHGEIGNPASPGCCES